MVAGADNDTVGIYFPKAAAEAIDCSVYTGRKGEHYICLSNTAGVAPIYRLYLDKVIARSRLVVDTHLIDDRPDKGGYLLWSRPDTLGAVF